MSGGQPPGAAEVLSEPTPSRLKPVPLARADFVGPDLSGKTAFHQIQMHRLYIATPVGGLPAMNDDAVNLGHRVV